MASAKIRLSKVSSSIKSRCVYKRNRLLEDIYEYESTGRDPSTQYMLLPQNHTTYKLACLDLFEEIYNIKCQNMVNGLMAEIESLDMLYGNESIPREYEFELQLKGVKNKFEVCGCEPY